MKFKYDCEGEKTPTKSQELMRQLPASHIDKVDLAQSKALMVLCG